MKIKTMLIEIEEKILKIINSPYTWNDLNKIELNLGLIHSILIRVFSNFNNQEERNNRDAISKIDDMLWNPEKYKNKKLMQQLKLNSKKMLQKLRQ